MERPQLPMFPYVSRISFDSDWGDNIVKWRNKMAELKFKADTKHRKQWFTGISFSHPAKMSLPLQIWLIENYTKPGETILDPMSGSGTLMVCCSLGRNCILVELEEKFCKMMEANWEKVKQRGAQLGYTMGQAQIIQGDARNLEGLLVDKCLFSPPFAGNTGGLKSLPVSNMVTMNWANE